MGVIPSGQENHSRAEHLNFPGKELGFFFKEKKKIYIYIVGAASGGFRPIYTLVIKSI